ncbi:alkaline phosphatase family protein [Asanoa sp. NPDC049573]|uniref:alkaline phosphatase family protein n=1 Tax=Asanoa sp. NPDC049573 TaxID=3155396 RepID=UPI0034297787
MSGRLTAIVAAIIAVLAMAGCAHRPQAPTADAKVLVIAEENKTYDRVIGDPDAPYISMLAQRFGSAASMDAGYPPDCPSLAAYLLMTSGSTHDVCDDADSAAHRIDSDNVFTQVARAGREWRDYADSAPGTCASTNSADGRYLVRHTPAAYYTREAANCRRWHVPLGDLDRGALHDDLTSGNLPAYAFVSPDACHDMHGAPSCPDRLVASGDEWLRQWLPRILAGPDYTAGRLVVIVTWDEGSVTDNHIPTVVISPRTAGVHATVPFTLCSILRTTEEILRLPLLGCAATATSMRGPFAL